MPRRLSPNIFDRPSRLCSIGSRCGQRVVTIAVFTVRYHNPDCTAKPDIIDAVDRRAGGHEVDLEAERV